MPTILYIETTTKACSVGLSYNGHLIALRESVNREYSHSSSLTVFIEEVMKEAGKEPAEIDAVAVSQGPGSYTGLRIGISAAKGFCHALDIPLIAVDTMQSLTKTAILKLARHDSLDSPATIEAVFCPMIDARRMEVYYALYSYDLLVMQETKAEVIDANTFNKLLQDYKVFFFGDGAEKCQSVIKSCNAVFIDDIWPSAVGMLQEAEQKYGRGEFVDLAYFEPFYLKDFVAGKPKVKGLYS
jgi:tRNA threonylcarbamoyladenosine biosynthesis protein TsaB